MGQEVNKMNDYHSRTKVTLDLSESNQLWNATGNAQHIQLDIETNQTHESSFPEVTLKNVGGVRIYSNSIIFPTFFFSRVTAPTMEVML